MKSLKDVKGGDRHSGQTPRRGRYQAPDHGYGHYQGREITSAGGTPSGRSMELNVRGYELSVRKADAEKIEVS